MAREEPAEADEDGGTDELDAAFADAFPADAVRCALPWTGGAAGIVNAAAKRQAATKSIV